MGDSKAADRKKLVKKSYLKTLEALEKICEDCQIDFGSNFSEYTRDVAENSSEWHLQRLTAEMKSALIQLMKMYYYDEWVEIAKKGFEGEELNQEIGALALMIEMEPAYSYEHFKSLFKLIDELNRDINVSRLT